MSEELADCHQRQAGNFGRNQAGQPSLNHSKDKMAEPTWNAKHVDHPRDKEQLRRLALTTADTKFSLVNPKSVLISGAGIAGPTLAFWLKAAGLQPTLVERGSSLLTVKADVTRTVLE